MKLIYRVKFRAWGITFGTTSGEVDLNTVLPIVASHLLASHISEDGDTLNLVNERGVYIAIVLD
jgi:hypothetical protein